MEEIIKAFRADVLRTEAARLRFITMRIVDARAVLDAVEQTGRAQRTTEGNGNSGALVARELTDETKLKADVAARSMEIAAMLPNGASVTNVYDAYEEGLREAARQSGAQGAEPVAIYQHKDTGYIHHWMDCDRERYEWCKSVGIGTRIVYAAPVSRAALPANTGERDAIRNAALQEAAALCDAKYEARAASGHAREASTARALSDEIYALKSSATTSEEAAPAPQLARAAQAIFDSHKAACLTDPVLSLKEMARDKEEVLVEANLLLDLYGALAAAQAPQQQQEPVIWYDASAPVDQGKMYEEVRSLSIQGTSHKFGDYTVPLYATPSPAKVDLSGLKTFTHRQLRDAKQYRLPLGREKFVALSDVQALIGTSTSSEDTAADEQKGGA